MDNHRKSGVKRIWINRKLIIAEHDGHLIEVLDGYDTFLQEKDLAMVSGGMSGSGRWMV